ncbi:MAG: hypothetical protein KY476_18945 [Planctomycetes bacterium]|nr:hypothetical protein [Planctomycetota bacterium]
MKRFTNPTFVLTAFALALGIVIGCNYGTPPENSARAEAGPPSPEDYVEDIQRDVERVRATVEELSGFEEFADVPRPVLIAATCKAYDMPLETYRFITDADTRIPSRPAASQSGNSQ